jgi:L-ascorbate metabolism protein UlaG (beta-lactamase superfamily)
MAESGGLLVRWLGHSTVVLDLDGSRFVSDPLLRPNNGPLRRRGPVPVAAWWSGCRVVLLSHLHHDHAELSSLRILGDVPILTSDVNAGWLRRRGLRGVGLPDDWFEVASDLPSVRMVEAVHHSRPMPHRPNGANGHLLRSDSRCVWVAGDTDLFPGIADLPRLAGREVDLAVVPIAGWGPRLSAGHMGPHEAAVACARSGARWVLPVHWGTLHPPLMHLFGGWLDRPFPEFVEALAREAPGCELVRLSPGEAWTPPDAVT